MMGHTEIRERVMMPGRMRPEQMPKGGMLPRFVERDPVLGAVAQSFDDHLSIIRKIVCHIAPGKAPAAVLQGLRRVPVEERDEGQDASFKQRIDKAFVVIQSLLVDLPPS